MQCPSRATGGWPLLLWGRGGAPSQRQDILTALAAVTQSLWSETGQQQNDDASLPPAHCLGPKRWVRFVTWTSLESHNTRELEQGGSFCEPSQGLQVKGAPSVYLLGRDRVDPGRDTVAI